MSNEEILKVKNLFVKYKGVIAVNNVSFSVKKNEVLGIIGANGAGKTSLVEAIEGLRTKSRGEITIMGLNPQKDRVSLYNQIGVQLQQTSYPEYAKVQDICELFSCFYNNPVPFDELLMSMGIDGLKNKYVNKLSGGQRQKLSIVLSLLCRPKIVFWDELTTGLDPLARHNLYDKILQYKKTGLTIIIVTHFMEEVEKLCDRVIVMQAGKLLGIGTPTEITKLFRVKSLDDVFTQISNGVQ